MKITAIAAALLLVPGLAFAAGEAEQAGTAEQGKMQQEQMEKGQTGHMGQMGQEAQQEPQEEFGQEQQKPAKEQQAVEGEQRQQKLSQQSGKVRGNVVAIDLTQGTMRLSHAEVALGETELPDKSVLESKQEAREGEEPSAEQITQRQQIEQRKDVTVYGTPGQLSSQDLGKLVTLEFVKYGNQAWLAEGAGELSDDFGESQQAQGAIRNINAGTGSFSLGGQTGQFYVHPRELENLRAGQLVSITYQQVGNNNWVEQVQQQQEQKQEEQQPEGIEGQQLDPEIDVDVEGEQQGMEGQEGMEGIEGQPEPEEETDEGGGLFE